MKPDHEKTASGEGCDHVAGVLAHSPQFWCDLPDSHMERNYIAGVPKDMKVKSLFQIS